MDTAEELHLRAVEAGRSNDYTRSLELVAQARALTDDPDLLARLDVSAAYGEAETGNHRVAVSLCEGVIAQQGLPPFTSGLANSQLAMIEMHNGELTEAVRRFADAIGQLVGHPEHLGVSHLNRGLAHLRLGEVDLAVRDFTASAEHYEQADIPTERAKAVFNRAYAQLLRNDLVAAMRGMDEAGAVLAEQSKVNAAIVQQDRAEVLLASGRAQEAAAALESAAAAFGSEKLRRLQAECELILARTLLAEDPARSKAVAQNAARRFVAQGSTTWAARARAATVVAEIQAGKQGAALMRRGDKLVLELRGFGHRREADRLALHLARAAVRRRDLADAATRLAKVRVSEDSPIPTRLLAREVRAELAAARAQPGRVRMHARQGLADLHSWQATFGSLDLQTSTVGHGQHLARLGMRAAFDDGTPAVAFEWSERARALASRVTALRPPPDPALAADLAELRMTDPSNRARARVLRERIRSHSWFSAVGSIGEPVDLATLQQALQRDDAALVAHIVLDGAVTALAVTGEDTAVVPIGPAEPLRLVLDRVAADLDFAAHNRDGDIAGAVRASLRTDLSALADVLVRPLISAIGYRRLVLTPSAMFTGTPWTCLPGLIGRPLTIPTSATRWVEQRSEPISPPRVAGFVAGPGLARAEDEVRRAAAAWPKAQTLVGGEADATRVGWLAAGVDLFHVAGHGQHPGDHPLFSAIDLADGPWFGHDIDLLPRIPDLVVLSACDLGRATVLHGEESVGMSAAWLHAGARAVISSPALLADELACEVFADWHARVAAGEAPADALARVTSSAEEIVPLLTFGAGW